MCCSFPQLREWPDCNGLAADDRQSARRRAAEQVTGGEIAHVSCHIGAAARRIDYRAAAIAIKGATQGDAVAKYGASTIGGFPSMPRCGGHFDAMRWQQFVVAAGAICQG